TDWHAARIRLSDSSRLRPARRDGIVGGFVPLRRARLPGAVGGGDGAVVAPRGRPRGVRALDAGAADGHARAGVRWMSEHGAIAITYGATEAQRHRERTEWQRLTGDDSTRGRKAANTDREDGHANPVVSRARFACPPSRSVPGPAPQARP